MSSKERIMAVIEGKDVDYTPLYAWCFGFHPPRELRWVRNGKERAYWYTMRLEHLHTLPYDWDIFDDLERVKRWLGLGIDDVIDISFPWSMHPDVKIRYREEKNVQCCFYETPEGVITQKVRKTEETILEGWVIQPEKPKLFEDFNLPRSEKFPVSSSEDLRAIKYLLYPPSKEEIDSYKEKIKLIREFTSRVPVAVQGWSAFGLDAVVWLMGVQNAVVSALTEPDFFQELVDTIYRFDRMRTEMMIEIGGVDIIVQRGWYGSTDFWSPQLIKKFVIPNLKGFTHLVHQAGLKAGYVMTTGVMSLIETIIESGVDLLYFADPQQENFDLVDLKSKINNRICVAGGLSSSLTLNRLDEKSVKKKTEEVLKKMGRKKFILSPVDSLFPDTPYQNVQAMIEAWRGYR